MGRLLLGVAILLCFLCLGLWVSGTMENLHSELCDTLMEAADLALSGDLDAGAALAQNAKARWEACWNGVASLADHAPMDEIDSLFARLRFYASTGAAADFAAECSRIAKLADAVGEAHSFTWWNLL